MSEYVSGGMANSGPFSPCGRWPSGARLDERATGVERISPGIPAVERPPHPAPIARRLRRASCWTPYGAAFSRKGRRGAPAPRAFLIHWLSCFGFLVLFTAPACAADLNDYPTSARADYVFACMKANGDTRESLDQCSCSIDVVASILPYDRYVAGETVASVSQQAGQIGNMLRNTTTAKDALSDLRRAQAEAQVRCF